MTYPAYRVPDTLTYEGRAYRESDNAEIFLPLDSYDVEDQDPDHGDTLIYHEGVMYVIPGQGIVDYHKSLW
jgi:hypothetical protein